MWHLCICLVYVTVGGGIFNWIYQKFSVISLIFINLRACQVTFPGLLMQLNKARVISKVYVLLWTPVNSQSGRIRLVADGN